MTIYPAIDLYEGKAVRLTRGDYAQMTIYSDDPAATARGFKEAGATAIHVVDLEGARDGEPVNFGCIKRIVDESGLEIQAGGGIRTRETIEKYLSIGVKRVILGTAAVSKPGFVQETVARFGGAIAVSVDIKDGFVAIKGWTETSDMDALGFCRTIEETGVKTIICTDISKDGLLSGTNMELYRTLRARLNIAIIASGGITSLDEIKTLSALGIDGAILGKALYAGSLDLAEAIRAAG
ncbi:MAG: 1-(5-phosphoribosyl)-5-[(5-phosphoribosylamino)methylideneamino]imidazole-4-carboxamide isomerase [Oscillospiraceae bacterium]|jgi:phosphoribosylformimino-5-aminoimidazole carboxamide ribotide isomerase|nr:1-(5-phosphoribosyl)-5-[(5-phosphoribosylamino)methylideneamino]imidazole-4-carboxamide isomerase [Oscillospiraceae bacterium]